MKRQTPTKMMWVIFHTSKSLSTSEDDNLEEIIDVGQDLWRDGNIWGYQSQLQRHTNRGEHYKQLRVGHTLGISMFLQCR